MKNRVSDGHYLGLPAPHDVAAGDGVQVGAIFGIAVTDAAQGAEAVLDLRRGVWVLPRVPGRAWAPGERIYWDAGRRLATAAAGKGRLAIGAAASAAAADAPRGDVIVGV